jgi:hypothetical protein
MELTGEGKSVNEDNGERSVPVIVKPLEILPHYFLVDLLDDPNRFATQSPHHLALWQLLIVVVLLDLAILGEDDCSLGALGVRRIAHQGHALVYFHDVRVEYTGTLDVELLRKVRKVSSASERAAQTSAGGYAERHEAASRRAYEDLGTCRQSRG